MSGFLLDTNIVSELIKPQPGTTSGCGHLLAGTTRVWETVTGASASTHTWYVTDNPITANLTKGTLGNRSYIRIHMDFQSLTA